MRKFLKEHFLDLLDLKHDILKLEIALEDTDKKNKFANKTRSDASKVI